MKNWTLSVRKSSPQRLADILEMDGEKGWKWKAEELGCIFQHQIMLPLQVGLRELCPVLPAGLRKLLLNGKNHPERFGDLFFTGKADARLLHWTRILAFRCLDKKPSPLPRQVLQLIVCLAEAAAGTPFPRSRQSLIKTSRLHHKALKFSWLDSSCRSMLLTHLSQFNSSRVPA